jgi:putative ATPase
MLIFAGEDVGMADPQALGVVSSAAQAFDYVGMPEGRYHLAQACLYLSTAPKSNSAFAFFDAISVVRNEQADEVPDPLKDGNRDGKAFGHGEGYLYPHAYRDHWVAQQYLPDVLQGRIFYQPSEQGYEASIQETVSRNRETQLAAFFSQTASEQSGSLNYWEARTIGSSGELLNEFRDRLTEWCELSRNTLALVLNAGEGLLLGEFLRHISEENVYGLVESSDEKQILGTLFNKTTTGTEAKIAVDSSGCPASFEIADLRFERIVGRNVLQKHADKSGFLETLKPWISPDGFFVFGETVPALGQRLSDLIPEELLESDFRKRLKAAEKEIYLDEENVRSSWTPSTLRDELKGANWNIIRWQVKEYSIPTMIRTEQIEQWFPSHQDSPHSSYGQRLSAYFSPEQLNYLRETFLNEVAGKVVEWHSVSLFMQLKPKISNDS